MMGFFLLFGVSQDFFDPVDVSGDLMYTHHFVLIF